MTNLSDRNFGILIAYLLPGFVSLLGVAYFSDAVQAWLISSTGSSPSVGGFLYVTLASVGAGMTASTIRWAVVDSIHHATGLPRPRWDFSHLQQHIEAYAVLEQNHYRFYQFYGNGLVAIVFLIVCRGFAGVLSMVDVGLLALGGVLLAGSRDTLQKYYRRVSALLRAEHTSAMRCPAQMKTVCDNTSQLPCATLRWLRRRIRGILK